MNNKETTRRRVLTYVNSTAYDSLFGKVDPTVSLCQGTQITTSSGHGGPPKRGTSWDVGGGFHTSKQSYSHTGSDERLRFGAVGSDGRWREGPLYAHTGTIFSAQWSSAGASSVPTLLGLGTTAVARTIPTNPVSNMLVAIGEVGRDGIPDLPALNLLRDRTNIARKSGGEFLNLEFGWKPLVNDLLALQHAISESEKILSQYERDSGKNVRRSYTFPTVSNVTTTVTTGTYPAPATYAGWYASTSTKTKTTTTQKDRWFSGCYTYYLHKGTNAREKILRAAQEANKLYGARLTPEVVWNLAPWTWAADWMTNIGDVLHNASAFQNDGLVMRYGYVMERSFTTNAYAIPNVQFSNGQRRSFTQTFTTEVKQRVKATPYGFALNTDGFTPRQWAIVGALGLSRAPGKMR